ncbi:MAG TPA: bifunctional demethylmenaquinone methyltransferase/2-methoxy-6-polyprenyl-1,4-benzoquinol methylase UbiE [Verrucomicrobiae bacterium]|jgi:demethylmenaquinone methyltransferase/2-methoxy-6-polyprenyl-1,4-benzoquinol methylase|nr:bifunctional demethylmenaquinone methyltransferase/2-methoxy-6-polyprenyl-1,4-benzoquinol methylase UbiE [Verrucomicrobiae bacterium]
MTNKFYTSGEQRAAKVGELFASIASRYDLINDIQSFGLHRIWKRRLLRLARVQPGERALDLCCGTGDLALALAKNGADVKGLDFSEAMLRVAREKSKAQNPTSKIEFVCGDAQRIPFPDATFDVLTIGYGLRNLADLDAGLKDMWRVTKPGGRLLALEFGKPDNAVWRGIYFGYLKFLLPIFGRIFCGNAAAYGYILESLKHYPAQQEVAAMMRKLGWQNVRVVNLMGGIMSIHCAEKPSMNPAR